MGRKVPWLCQTYLWTPSTLGRPLLSLCPKQYSTLHIYFLLFSFHLCALSSVEQGQCPFGSLWGPQHLTQNLALSWKKEKEESRAGGIKEWKKTQKGNPESQLQRRRLPFLAKRPLVYRDRVWSCSHVFTRGWDEGPGARCKVKKNRQGAGGQAKVWEAGALVSLLLYLYYLPTMVPGKHSLIFPPFFLLGRIIP